MVEFVKLYHSRGLNAFRLTPPGVLLLGRFFSVWDIAAYWLAVVVRAIVDISASGSGLTDRESGPLVNILKATLLRIVKDDAHPRMGSAED